MSTCKKLHRATLFAWLASCFADPVSLNLTFVPNTVHQGQVVTVHWSLEASGPIDFSLILQRVSPSPGLVVAKDDVLGWNNGGGLWQGTSMFFGASFAPGKYIIDATSETDVFSQESNTLTILPPPIPQPPVSLPPVPGCAIKERRKLFMECVETTAETTTETTTETTATIQATTSISSPSSQFSNIIQSSYSAQAPTPKPQSFTPPAVTSTSDTVHTPSPSPIGSSGRESGIPPALPIVLGSVLGGLTIVFGVAAALFYGRIRKQQRLGKVLVPFQVCVSRAIDRKRQSAKQKPLTVVPTATGSIQSSPSTAALQSVQFSPCTTTPLSPSTPQERLVEELDWWRSHYDAHWRSGDTVIAGAPPRYDAAE